MKRFFTEVFYKTKSEYRKTFLSFSTFELSYNFISLIEKNMDSITLLAKLLIPLECKMNESEYPFFENVTDAESYIMNTDSIKIYNVIDKAEFDSLYNDIMTRIEKNMKEIRFLEMLRNSLYIVSSENVNGLDTEDYEILSETIQECAKRFDIFIEEE